VNILTKYTGEVAIKNQNIISFSHGLPGFAKETKFMLLDLTGNPLFQILQSVKSQDIAFIVTDPYHFYCDYEFEIDNNLLENLQIQDKNDVFVLTIVTLKSPFDKSTINLKAPLIINRTNKQGKQYILTEIDYTTKAPIAPQAVSKAKGD